MIMMIGSQIFFIEHAVWRVQGHVVVSPGGYFCIITCVKQNKSSPVFLSPHSCLVDFLSDSTSAVLVAFRRTWIQWMLVYRPWLPSAKILVNLSTNSRAQGKPVRIFNRAVPSKIWGWGGGVLKRYINICKNMSALWCLCGGEVGGLQKRIAVPCGCGVLNNASQNIFYCEKNWNMS